MDEFTQWRRLKGDFGWDLRRTWVLHRFEESAPPTEAGGSGRRLTGRRKPVRLLLSAGCACLILMALTHVAERLHILPGMGWGLPNSPGHYLDLFSAISGVALLLVGCVLRLLQSD